MRDLSQMKLAVALFVGTLSVFGALMVMTLLSQLQERANPSRELHLDPKKSPGEQWNTTGVLTTGSTSLKDLMQICGMREGQSFVKEVSYGRNSWLISLNDPNRDTVVSKSLLQQTNGTHPSTDEMNVLCSTPVITEWNKSKLPADETAVPLVACMPGKVAIEVGAAVGMVSLYLAAHGMQVVAIDAVQPNVARLNESACLNGVKECLSTAPGNQLACAAACHWRRFAPASGLDVINAAVTRAPGASRAVRTHEGNLAGTMGGMGMNRKESGWYGDAVITTSIDALLEQASNGHLRFVGLPGQGSVDGATHGCGESSARESEPIAVELLHLTNQGDELETLHGAARLMAGRRIRNVLFTFYVGLAGALGEPEEEVTERGRQIVRLLDAFVFWDISGCGRFPNRVDLGLAAPAPTRMSTDEALVFIDRPEWQQGDHPSVLATLAYAET